MPMYHAYGMFINLQSLLLRQTLVVMYRFQEKLFLSCIEKYKVSFLYCVPPLVFFLLKDPLVDQYDLRSVKYLCCGAAPLKSDVEKNVTKRMNLEFIQQAYGLTEATFVLCINKHPTETYKPGHCGKLVPGVEVKVVDVKTGKSLGANKEGEICVRGLSVMRGYLRNEAATSNAIDKDKWLHTGDIGYYDEDRYFFIIDRLKELIKYKAYQVAPAEIEGILMSHPSVKDAAVVGIPDDAAGELPKAYVVKVPGSQVEARELIEWVSGKLSPQKRLRGGVEFVMEIPKNPTGKILRRLLRDMKSKL